MLKRGRIGHIKNKNIVIICFTFLSILLILFASTGFFSDFFEKITGRAIASDDYLLNLKLDEGTGTTVSDSSGNGNTGIINGATWTSGKSGNALNFDGVNDYINLGDVLDLTSNSFTIAAWIYPKSFGEGGYGRIVDKFNLGNTGYYFYIRGDTNDLAFGVTYSSVSSNDFAITTNTWQHVAVTFNGNKATFYVNSINVGSPILTSLPVGNNLNLLIGNRLNGDRTFNGTIDEVMIFNRSLTASEIQELYNSYSGVTPTSCIDNDRDKYNQSATGCGTADCNDNDASKWQLLNGYANNDNDNYGYGSAQSICSGLNLPSGYSQNNLDCDDTNSSINPSAIEICDNGIDENCNPLDDTCQPGNDNDGDSVVNDLDCNDNNVSIKECLGCTICSVSLAGLGNGFCVQEFKPIMNNFENSITTNLTNKNLLKNISNFTIGVPNMAKIEFVNDIKLFRNASGTCEKLNFDNYVNISPGKIEIDSANLPELNKSAVITMYNVVLTNPFILKDGIKCNDCEIVSYENNTLLFRVSYFSKYSIAGKDVI